MAGQRSRRLTLAVAEVNYPEWSIAKVEEATARGDSIPVREIVSVDVDYDVMEIRALKALIRDTAVDPNTGQHRGYAVSQVLSTGGIPIAVLKQTLVYNGLVMHDDARLADYMPPPPEGLPYGNGPTIYLTWGRSRAPWQHVLCSSLAEFLGTFVITFTACSAAIQHRELLPVAVAYGLSVIVMMFCTVDVSGGHLNPAISLALFFTRIQGLVRTICYIAAQLLGSTCAMLLLKWATPESMHMMEQSMKAYHGPLGANTLGIDVLPMQAFYLEATMTFLIAIVYFLTNIDPPVTGMERVLLSPIPVGFSVTMAMLATGNISGGCFNPARAFGPAVVMRFYVDLWPYMLGPVLGAVLAGLFHRFVWLPRHEQMWDSYIFEGPQPREMKNLQD